MFRTLKNTFKKKMLGYIDSNKNHYPVLKYKIELRLKSRYYVSYYTKKNLYTLTSSIYTCFHLFTKHFPSPSFPVRWSTEDTLKLPLTNNFVKKQNWRPGEAKTKAVKWKRSNYVFLPTIFFRCLKCGKIKRRKILDILKISYHTHSEKNMRERKTSRWKRFWSIKGEGSKSQSIHKRRLMIALTHGPRDY